MPAKKPLSKAEKLAVLEKNEQLLKKMKDYLKDPANTVAPSDEEIRGLAEEISDAKFVNGWGGGG